MRVNGIMKEIDQSSRQGLLKLDDLFIPGTDKSRGDDILKISCGEIASLPYGTPITNAKLGGDVQRFNTHCDGVADSRIYPITNKVYAQQNTVGLASYHFDGFLEGSGDKAYISYANAHSSWNLDNGQSPPAKKYFENAHYDRKTQTFSGTINWSPTTFNGDQKWVYKMIFSHDFNTIQGGYTIRYN